jgi:hypothetical protein
MGDGRNRFVILEHRDKEGVHWDLMLEQPEHLATWRLDEPPDQVRWDAASAQIETHRIFDHRKRYLDYEGPIGGDRGHVRIHDRGRYGLIEMTDHLWIFQLFGQTIEGVFRLTIVSGDEWTLSRHEESE